MHAHLQILLHRARPRRKGVLDGAQLGCMLPLQRIHNRCGVARLI
jgi:hypothetical protein